MKSLLFGKKTKINILKDCLTKCIKKRSSTSTRQGAELTSKIGVTAMEGIVVMRPIGVRLPTVTYRFL